MAIHPANSSPSKSAYNSMLNRLKKSVPEDSGLGRILDYASISDKALNAQKSHAKRAVSESDKAFAAAKWLGAATVVAGAAACFAVPFAGGVAVASGVMAASSFMVSAFYEQAADIHSQNIQNVQTSRSFARRMGRH